MDKEQENQFKEHIKEMAREEIQRTFTDNLMETLNSVFIFKYVETLELKCKKQKDIIDKSINELYILKGMIYKSKTREENFEIQRKISSLIKELNGKEVLE